MLQRKGEEDSWEHVGQYPASMNKQWGLWLNWPEKYIHLNVTKFVMWFHPIYIYLHIVIYIHVFVPMQYKTYFPRYQVYQFSQKISPWFKSSKPVQPLSKGLAPPPTILANPRSSGSGPAMASCSWFSDEAKGCWWHVLIWSGLENHACFVYTSGIGLIVARGLTK